MFFKVPALLATVAFFGLSATATPISNDVEHASNTLMKRGGPSGQVLSPAGDSWIYSEVGWPGAGFHFVYKPAYVKNPDPNCVNQRQACYASTKWLEVSLVSLTVPGQEYKLADYLHTSVDNPSANIDTWLGVPVDAVCGDYRVKVIEHQRYFNQWVEFQSAAPLVHMQCVRYAGPGQ
ncbi:hypothetical protein P389DRAFT_13351 [Cystobasidium minutum MCA 4210]|uniref:uncharacterized protein n=1 Tax=Cystobasidium minutum MCA 4210 TaxID=1397322 RepID=UPI0034CEDE7E|eukprot:jgi/Rhomi1/13351/CE13350_118